MRTGTFVGDAWCGVGDELCQFSRGCAVIDAVEVGVFLQCDESVLVDMAQCPLQPLSEGIGWATGIYIADFATYIENFAIEICDKGNTFFLKYQENNEYLV